MSAIELCNISKRWGDSFAVTDVSFKVEQGTFAVLLGPSGCGKSTTLRMISGLEDVSEGKLLIGDTDMTTARPAQRNLSMVFQSYALFPHLNVKENILFGLKVRKIPIAEQEQRLARVAELVGLAELLLRKPAQLSGGQRQRVALARAFIAENPICLMDEPLSNLDAKLRHDMRIEIRALQQRLKMTVVYVTHDQAEAMSMADKVILIKKGQIEQEGTPDELYNKPATTFAAAFIGTPPMNLLDITKMGTLPPLLAEPTSSAILGIRPENIRIVDAGGIPARLISADYLGADTVITARIGTQELQVRTPGRVSVPEPYNARLQWQKEDVHLFDPSSGKRNDTIKATDF
ncbi:ABC transporter ATP-binding protein [Kiloniella laminariae]|uniref:ABC transporter ATP-binding protein n=1 Tax=Kiloniella laminariae TaxID=454162 RepID=A0ABT4LHR6_9PROT|nr:ABC transporter ATP-binding protein [Kiloniella laminariae]MCZ4280640.1 ABC transporter ATP-binding protein [Kiloniella laminariae]